MGVMYERVCREFGPTDMQRRCRAGFLGLFIVRTGGVTTCWGTRGGPPGLLSDGVPQRLCPACRTIPGAMVLCRDNRRSASSANNAPSQKATNPTQAPPQAQGAQSRRRSLPAKPPAAFTADVTTGPLNSQQREPSAQRSRTRGAPSSCCQRRGHS